MPKLPRIVILGLWITLIQLVLMSAARIAFWAYFNDAHNPIPTGELLTGLYLGGKFDLRLILLGLLPLLLLGGFRWFSPFEGRWRRHLWLGYLVLVFTVIELFYVFDFGHFAYLGKPLNATVLRFAVDLQISMDMVWETYPVITLVLSIVVLAAAYAWLMYLLLQRVTVMPAWQPLRRYKIITATLMTFLVIFGIYGKFSYYPLRWSDAFATTHPFTSAVTLNPVLYFFDTLKNKDINYSVEETKKHYERMADFLKIENPDKQALNYTRKVNKPGPLAERQPNIIMVYLESFASYKTGIFGNPFNPTPHFDKLAKNSLFFSNYYTPQTGTARSVFTGITGLPDVELHRTSSRNPLIVDQHTIINAFKGYDKYYFLGGSANWGNIRGILSHNIPGLEIHEEGSYSSPRIDVWGISDLDLFKEAHKVLEKEDKPFFAIIQTSGNHRPYTIPENNHGFELETHNEEELRQHGFYSNAEFNSFRFMDHSIGHFMKLARQSDYFDNTIFVFYGDHGIGGYGGKHTPEFESHFNLTNLHVPLIIYAPKMLKPQKFDKIASEVDLLPTVAGLAAPGYTNTTLGRDLLDPRYDDQRYAFTIVYDKIPMLGLLNDNYLLHMRADNSQLSLHDIRNDDFKQDISASHPDITEQMQELISGIYETAKYMRFHNPNPLTEH
ncbi:MAG: LTA synthase family protein [Thiohalophilus sp.]|jgi:phosphoglycerol transferase MdoB-like AlkP superfamily enzyme